MIQLFTKICFFQLAYEAACDALILKNGYDKKLKDDIAIHKDFLCKGLFLDADKGNILKLSHDGKVLKASHGTKLLTTDQLYKTYGKDLHWEHFQEAKDNVKCSDAKFKYRFFENYFEIPAVILCAHVVDYIDEKQIKAIADTGCSVIVSGGKVGELAQHFCYKYEILVVRLMSKWDLRRLCRSLGATPLPRITPPTGDEAGHCDKVYVDEIGDTSVIIFRQEKEESAIATIVIGGSTDNIIDDIERATDDGINVFKALKKNGKMLAGAGATEIELAKQITAFGEATEILSRLYAADHEGKKYAGLDIEIIMAKAARGPKARENKDWDED